MNCADSDAGEPIKAAAFEEKDALIGVPVSFYEGLVRSLSVARKISAHGLIYKVQGTSLLKQKRLKWHAGRLDRLFVEAGLEDSMELLQNAWF
ncbi:hypothetical protein CDL15_Pgr029204 [Punica granatum]|uniref:Uncharacterized protein n=1 Tax=Punica granatum TaxID=22663 RepID=A0A218XD25_PUNGR|nr:hypothetical protein CDL15_Pgr029204 [Punica granatum]